MLLLLRLIVVAMPGMIEYWCGTSYCHPDGDRVVWSSKLDTDLFDLAKAKATALSLEVG